MSKLTNKARGWLWLALRRIWPKHATVSPDTIRAFRNEDAVLITGIDCQLKCEVPPELKVEIRNLEAECLDGRQVDLRAPEKWRQHAEHVSSIKCVEVIPRDKPTEPKRRRAQRNTKRTKSNATKTAAVHKRRV